MTKVIENIELLKKLQPYLEDVETEYVYTTISRMLGDAEASNEMCLERTEDHTPMCLDYKTLTLEEAIELLPEEILCDYGLLMGKKTVHYVYDDCFAENIKYETEGETLLEAIEKMLEYLIDNDLLGDQ